MKNNYGFTLIETCVSIVIVSIVGIMILNSSINLNGILSENIKNKKINQDKIILHKELSRNFSTYNISNISKTTNDGIDKYTISYSKYSYYTNQDIYRKNVLYIKDNDLYIDNQVLESNSNLKYKNIKITKYEFDNNDYYFILSIILVNNKEESSIDFYYVNDISNVSLPNDTIVEVL